MIPSYFVVMIDFGRRGVQAEVDPEITRREVLSRIRSGEYPRDRIVFIHHVHDGCCEIVTDELLTEALAGIVPEPEPFDHQAARWDAERDRRKHFEPAEG